MKKLLVLALVCGIASLASAGASFVSSATDVMPGDVVTIQLVADFPCNGFGLQVVSDAGGTAAVGTVNAALSFLPSAGNAVNNGNSLITGATGSAFGASVAAGAVIYDFTYTVAADAVKGSIITISSTDLPAQFLTSFISNASTFVQGPLEVSTALNVVPEPATLALLGLGALVLRRKK